MSLPSSRELELETLLRDRDTKLTELNASFFSFSRRFVEFFLLVQDEVTRLRQFLSVQPAASATDPVTLPPPLVSLLLPHLNPTPSLDPGSSSSSTVTAALMQRVRLLQEENDELYDILKRGETGRLKEEVRGLRRVVTKLESALRGTSLILRLGCLIYLLLRVASSDILSVVSAVSVFEICLSWAQHRT